MDHMKIIRRAWNITFSYRALWIFGIILALTVGGSASGSYNAGSNSGGMNPRNNFGSPFRGGMPFSPQVMNTLIAVGIALICVAILIGIVLAVLRYVAEVSLIRMVNEDETGEPRKTVRQGFKLGWSRGAWRVFLINLIVGFGTFVVIMLLILIALSPLLLWITRNNGLGVFGTVLAIGMFILVMFFAILVGAVISILQEVFWRKAVLENKGVFESMSSGYALVRAHLTDSILIGLILFGLKLLYSIVMIPVVIVLLIAAVVIGGLPALLVWAVINAIAGAGAAAWIGAAVIGLPTAFLVLLVPTVFIGGLWQTFTSSVWTLTYREFTALEGVSAAPVTPPAAPTNEEVVSAWVLPEAGQTTDVATELDGEL